MYFCNVLFSCQNKNSEGEIAQMPMTSSPCVLVLHAHGLIVMHIDEKRGGFPRSDIIPVIWIVRDMEPINHFRIMTRGHWTNVRRCLLPWRGTWGSAGTSRRCLVVSCSQVLWELQDIDCCLLTSHVEWPTSARLYSSPRTEGRWRSRTHTEIR